MTHKIPRRGRAGVAFAGVELADAWIFLLSIPVGLFVGGFLGMGTKAFLGLPLAGYFLNRSLLAWQARQMPGALREWLFAQGISGYSRRLTSQQVLFTGDGAVLLPGRRLEEGLRALKGEDRGTQQ